MNQEANRAPAITFNGRVSAELRVLDESVEEALSRWLHDLDGVNEYSLILWKCPPNVDFADCNPEKDSKEYIQAAGKNSRLTVEIRKFVDGEYLQFTLGVNQGDDGDRPSEMIRWDDFEVVVCTNEVLDADGALRLFLAYLETDDVPRTYTRRAH
jgi:hypothetical protein